MGPLPSTERSAESAAAAYVRPKKPQLAVLARPLIHAAAMAFQKEKVRFVPSSSFLFPFGDHFAKTQNHWSRLIHI